MFRTSHQESMSNDLLFLPGLLCDGHLWHHQVAALPGSTVADLTLDDDVDAMARRALATMPGDFALCGLSMGGYVALAIMRLAPERVTRLCLMDTSARPDTEIQSRRRRGLMAMSRGNRFRGVTPRLLPQLVHPDRLTDEALCREVMEMAERVGQEAFLRQQQAILSRPDSRPQLAAIAVPTLVAVGSHDILTPPELAEEIRDGIQHARLRVVPQSGHLPPLEQPGYVTDMLREWLTQDR